MQFLDLNSFLMWVIAGGGSVMMSSWLLERWAWYQSKESKVKENIFFAFASVIGVGAYLLVTYAPEFVVAAQPFFMIEAGIFGSIYLGKNFHLTTKEDKKAG